MIDHSLDADIETCIKQIIDADAECVELMVNNVTLRTDARLNSIRGELSKAYRLVKFSPAMTNINNCRETVMSAQKIIKEIHDAGII